MLVAQHSLPRPRSAEPVHAAAPFFCALAAVLALAGAAQAAERGLMISHPWIRSILPSLPAAGYFTLSNETATPRELVGARSPACGSLTLHRSISRGGTERMEMVKSVTVPAHGAVSFAPGGYHLMCLSPSGAVRPGQAIAVTLSFADGNTVTTDFPVRGAAGTRQ
ncbi:MAG TPA: copper chaperone PCu(A)C [Stellaceae bacterium]|nr:copper chaperone PCu(A)C [Stellaceae bacterium]